MEMVVTLGALGAISVAVTFLLFAAAIVEGACSFTYSGPTPKSGNTSHDAIHGCFKL